MGTGRDLGKRHRNRAASKLVDSVAFARAVTAMDPEWRSRRKVSGPLQREALLLLREDREARGEQTAAQAWRPEDFPAATGRRV